MSKYVNTHAVPWTITFYSEKIRRDIMGLPKGLQTRYIHLTKLMTEHGPNLKEPHTKALGNGLFEMRLKSEEGIARVMYCTAFGRRIVMLHSFIKKSPHTPLKDLETERKHMNEVIARIC